MVVTVCVRAADLPQVRAKPYPHPRVDFSRLQALLALCCQAGSHLRLSAIIARLGSCTLARRPPCFGALTQSQKALLGFWCMLRQAQCSPSSASSQVPPM